MNIWLRETPKGVQRVNLEKELFVIKAYQQRERVNRKIHCLVMATENVQTPVKQTNVEVNSKFFEDYVAICKSIEKLGGVDKEITIKERQYESQHKISLDFIQRLSLCKLAIEVHNERIGRNENPGFIRYYFDVRYYIWWDREEKVIRLRKEREKLEKLQTRLQAQAEQARALEEVFNIELQAAKESKKRKGIYESERSSMVQHVVALNPSARLNQLEEKIRQQSETLALESCILNGLKKTILALSHGKQKLNESMRLLNQAGELSQNAQQATTAELWAVSKTREDRLQRDSRQFQMKRDSLINAAQYPANEADRIIRNAWTHIPQVFKERYPSLTVYIGYTPLTKLEPASMGETFVYDLFGTFGESRSNNVSSKRIEQNMQVVSRSILMVVQQLTSLEHLLLEFGKNVAVMDSKLKVLEEQRLEEKNSIFTALQSQFMRFESCVKCEPGPETTTSEHCIHKNC